MAVKATASVTIADVSDGTDGTGIASTTVEYQAGSSGTSAPTGTWSTSIPATSASSPYLWTRVTYIYTDGSPNKIVYSVGSTPEGIEVGGRNLLVGTNQGTYKWANNHQNGTYGIEEVYWNGVRAVKMSCTTVSSGWKMFTFNGLLDNFEKLEPGGVYTLSYDTNGSVRVPLSNLYDSSATNRITKSFTLIKEELTDYGNHYEYRIILADTLTKSSQVVYLDNKLTDGTEVIIANLKLEKGNKATDWTPAPEDVDSSIKNAQDTADETQKALNEKIPMINGTQTAATYSWTGVAPFSELKDGQKITYWLPQSYSGSQVSLPYWKDAAGTTQQGTNSGAALNLTLADGSTTGKVAVYYGGTSRITTHFGAGQAIELTYKKLVKIGSYYYTGWWINANYNTNTLDNNIVYFTGRTGAKGIWATSLFMEDGSGTYQNICTASDGTVTSSNRTTAKTKIANTNGFKIGSSIYYSSATYAMNTNITGWGVVYSSNGSVFDSRYSFNTELVAGSLTAYKPVYLVGTIGEDNLFYLDTVWWTQTPNVEGKVYVLVGGCYDSTTSNCRITLYEDNRWYVYDGEKLQDFNLDSINTVDKKVISATARIETIEGKNLLFAEEISNLGTRTSTLEQTADGIEVRLTGAEQAASNAAKVATNYLKFENSGLIVGNHTDETLGNNVLIDTDSVDIRSGDTVLASYQANKIQLGLNNQDTVIDLCNGLASMYLGTDILGYQGFLLNSDSTKISVTSHEQVNLVSDKFEDGVSASASVTVQSWNSTEGYTGFAEISSASIVNNVWYNAHIQMLEGTIEILSKIDSSYNYISLNPDINQIELFGDVHCTGDLDVDGAIISDETLTVGSTTLISSDGLFLGTSPTRTLYGKGYMELYGYTPFIDFHYGNSTDDFTSRIISNSSGSLTCYGTWNVTSTLTASGDIWRTVASAEGHMGFKGGKSDIFLFSRPSSDSSVNVWGIWDNTYGGMFVYTTDDNLFVYPKLYCYDNLIMKNNYLIQGNHTNGTAYTMLKISNSNTVNLGNTSLVTRLYGTSVYLNGTSTAVTSDERVKKDFVSLDRYVDFFNRLNPIGYKYAVGKSGRTHLGFKAGEVLTALTESGLTSSDFAGYVEEAIDRESYIEMLGEGKARELFGDAWDDPEAKEKSLRYEEFTSLNTFMIQILREELSKEKNDNLIKMEKLEQEIQSLRSIIEQSGIKVNSCV